MTVSEISGWLLIELSDLLDLPTDESLVRTPFQRLDIDSLIVVALSSSIRDQFQCEFGPSDLLIATDLADVAITIEGRLGAGSWRTK